MNHLIFTAVLTACLGIGGYQKGPELFGSSPEGLGHDPHYDPGELNSSNTGSRPPLVSPHSTLSIAVYTSLHYVLTYLVGSFGRYNIHAKVFQWLMIIYPIVTTLTGFQFSNFQPYLLQVVPTMSGQVPIPCVLPGTPMDIQEKVIKNKHLSKTYMTRYTTSFQRVIPYPMSHQHKN
ncbi:hypothetical protein DSO57_1007174 [Entomophthora muscae]|uniref:Uncharacterized protein n=1 Tax=Entomophthora muscae TaxID=34485 RepID=A0ACC2U559_9FUNG|nr:hypothetical protein DSO57_1007174 [Entomophthora muscae]